MPTSPPPSRPDPLSLPRRTPRSSIRGPDTLRERSLPPPPLPNESFASEFLFGKIKGGRVVRPPCKEMLSFLGAECSTRRDAERELDHMAITAVRSLSNRPSCAPRSGR